MVKSACSSRTASHCWSAFCSCSTADQHPVLKRRTSHNKLHHILKESFAYCKHCICVCQKCRSPRIAPHGADRLVCHTARVAGMLLSSIAMQCAIHRHCFSARRQSNSIHCVCSPRHGSFFEMCIAEVSSIMCCRHVAFHLLQTCCLSFVADVLLSISCRPVALSSVAAFLLSMCCIRFVFHLLQTCCLPFLADVLPSSCC